MIALGLAAGCGGDDGGSIYESMTVGPSTGIDSQDGSETATSTNDGPLLDMSEGGQMTADDGMGTDPSCAKVDVLYVIDNSPSMYDEQVTLIQNFDAFVSDMQTTLADVESYHIGVVTSDNYINEGFLDDSSPTVNQNYPECRQLGGMVVEGQAGACLPFSEGYNFITEQDDLASKFGCMANVGEDGDSDERMGDAMIAAVKRLPDRGVRADVHQLRGRQHLRQLVPGVLPKRDPDDRQRLRRLHPGRVDSLDMLLRARIFPDAVTHGFTTRHGGVSEGRYASLNLGERWGDADAAVTENLRRVANAGAFERERLVRVRQVHGAEVLAADEVDADSQADGLCTGRERGAGTGTVVGVLTADCVPILICDREARVAAAVHSGWRGTVADIAGRAVEVLAGAGVPRSSLLAAIGPCIEVAAFEVGEEVAEQFDPRFVDRDLGPKPHVDLVACVRAQLEAAGLPANQIERVGGCTHADPELYFSYRRDGAGIGQQMSFIGLR